MTTVLDTMTDTTGWAGSGGASVYMVNEHKEYCADWLDKSLMFKFSGGTVTKSFASIDVEGHDDIVLTVWSRNKGRARHTAPEDFSYKIVINGSVAWYLPIHKTFHTVAVPVEDIKKIDSISITALSGADDYLIVSALYAVKDEYPLDVLKGAIGGLEAARRVLYPDGVKVTGLSCSAGAREVEIGFDVPYVERYSVIRISGGSSEEYHQISERNGSVVRFTGNYDGKKIKHDYTNADVSLWIPVELGRYEEEAVVPGIVVYGMAPEPDVTTSEVGTVIDGMSLDGSSRTRRELMGLRYTVLMSCESRHRVIGAVQGRIVRWMLGGNRLWINGRAHDIEFDQPPVETEPQGTDVIAQVQYTLRVSVREERARRITGHGAGLADIGVIIRRS